MTCIIGLEHEGQVYMGADSAASNWSEIKPTRLRKVFRLGPFLVGYTSSFRMGQLLQYQVGDIPIQTEADDVAYLVRSFVEPIRKALKDYGFAKVDNNREEIGFFLLGYKQRVYEVASDLQVNTYRDGVICTGSGSEYAYGAMAALPDLGPKKRILRALKIAGSYSTTVGGPYYVERL